jgi:dUTPase
MTESTFIEDKDLTFPLEKNLFRPEFIEIESGFKPQSLQPGDVAASVKLRIQQQWSFKRLKSALQDSLWCGDDFKTPSLVFVNRKQVTSYAVQQNYTLSQLGQIENEIIELIQQEEKEAAEQNHEVDFIGKWLMLRPGESVTEGLGFKVAIPNLSLLGPFVAEYRICSCSSFGAKYGINITNSFNTLNSGHEDEIKVNLKNNSNDLHFILHGSTIAEGTMAIGINSGSD